MQHPTPGPSRLAPDHFPASEHPPVQLQPRSHFRSSLAGLALAGALLLGACTDSGSEPGPDPSSPTNTESTASPTAAPTAPEPSGSASGEAQRSVVWEPECGGLWDPPQVPLFETSELAASAMDVEPEVWLLVEGEIVNVGDQYDGAYYTWPVLVQDGTIISPMGLGSDAIFDISLANGDAVEVDGTHSLMNFCTDEFNVYVEPGDYQAYLLVMDYPAYSERGERAVLAVFDSADISVGDDGELILP